MARTKSPPLDLPSISDEMRAEMHARLKEISKPSCTHDERVSGWLVQAREIRDPAVRSLFESLFGYLEEVLNRPQVAIIVGWKDICAALGGISSKTARRWVANEGLPIVAVNGTPTLSPEALRRWHETLKIKQSAR